MGDRSKQLGIAVFLPSVRVGRMSTRVSKFVRNQLEDKYRVAVLDPEELDLPLLQTPIHFYPDRSQVPQVLLEMESVLETADAFLVVTGSYNGSIPPALSNMLDHMSPASFACKPAGLLSYSIGPFGGFEATIQLRTCLSVLGSVTMPKVVCIPEVHNTLSENGDTQNTQLQASFANLTKQLDWYARALKDYRNKVGAIHVPFV